MTKQPDNRYENGYRLSDAFIKRWTRILLTILWVGVGAGMVVMIYMLIRYGDVPADELPTWGVVSSIVLFSIGFGVPLLMGAMLGGLAIHKYGWIPLLFVVGGLMAMGISAIDGFGFIAPYAQVSMVLGVIGIFVIAISFTKVPIWLGLPMLRSPRLYLRRGENDPKNPKNQK